MMGPGMGGGYGMMGGWAFGSPWGPAPELGLSDAQRKQIDTLVAASRDTARGDWQSMNEVHQKMAAAMGGARVDRAAATAAYRQMSDVMARQFERSLALREKIDAVLSDEQRAKLRELEQTGSGCGPNGGQMPMPGPGHMR
jgi:Spy/CpxP family protein refolding chaperone